MKIFKLLTTSLSLVAVLCSCSLPALTQTFNQDPIASVATPILQVNPTQPQNITPTNTVPAVTVSPMPTLFPPNTPVWSVYSYTCEFSAGGGTMTMSLAWSDRSTSEEGYIVYRDEQAIATLEPNSTNYVDVAFIATGKTLSYFVEAFTKDWRVSSSIITYGCQ